MYLAEPGEVSGAAALYALKNANYIHLDSARYYENEADAGRAVRESGLPREKVFVTTKLMPNADGAKYARETVENSLKLMNIGYIDQYLLHAPLGGKILESYDVLVEYQKKGLLKTIGVSNFGVAHLEAIKNSGRPLPQVNQIEMHPWCQQKEIVAWCRANNVVVVGYSPLGMGKKIGDPTIAQIAKKHNKSPAQILIRWSLQNGCVTIPKSSKSERIDENANVFDFELDEEDMSVLGKMADNGEDHVAWNPTNNDLATNFGPTVWNTLLLNNDFWNKTLSYPAQDSQAFESSLDYFSINS